MAEFRAMWRVAVGALRETFSGIRPYFIAVVVLALMHLASSDVRALCSQYDVKASVLPLFIFVFNAIYYILLFNFLFCVLACDVPLRKGHQRYIVLRCGRSVWAGGQILYLILLATIFIVWLFIASMIVLAGKLSFSLDWGRVYFSLARIELHGGVSFSNTIQSAFTAPQAFLISFGLQWLCFVLFGLIIYAINLATGRNIGMIVPCFFLLMYFHFAQYIVNGQWTTWISPVLLSRLMWHAYVRQPDMSYAIGFFLINIAALMICCVALARRRRGGIDMCH